MGISFYEIYKGLGSGGHSLAPLVIENRLLNRTPPKRMKVRPDLTFEMIVPSNLKDLVGCRLFMGINSCQKS